MGGGGGGGGEEGGQQQEVRPEKISRFSLYTITHKIPSSS